MRSSGDRLVKRIVVPDRPGALSSAEARRSSSLAGADDLPVLPRVFQVKIVVYPRAFGTVVGPEDLAEFTEASSDLGVCPFAGVFRTLRQRAGRILPAVTKDHLAWIALDIERDTAQFVVA